MSQRSTVILLGLVALAFGVFAAMIALRPQTITAEAGTLLEHPRPLPEFTLQATDGAALNLARLRGHWSLMFIGFTHCPDVCPNTLAFLKALSQQLASDGREAQVLFVSIDPERDTIPVLRQYVNYFDPEFIGATGDSAQLEALTRGASLLYVKVPGDTPETYTMDHSAAIVLIDPQARVAGYFQPPLQLEPIARDLEQLIPAV